jgi:hypothetical protein
MVLTFFTAFKTPFLNSLPPSRNSTASCSPVEAQMELPLYLPCSVTTSSGKDSLLNRKFVLREFDNNTHTTLF